MIPKPPFARDLSESFEIAEFERLKPRLKSLWSALSAREEEPYTSVVIPSLTLNQAELAKLEAASFYEERLLFLLIRLRNPQARMVYVTSQPVHPLILEYYFQLLAGIPASHARSRLTLLCAYDDSPRSLTEKILERPRLIQRIRYGIADRSRAFMTCFNSTPLERRLSVLLGIPLNGVDPALANLGTKSGSRKIFREAGVEFPEGFEDIRSEEDAVEALDELRVRRPGIRRALVEARGQLLRGRQRRFSLSRGDGPRSDSQTRSRNSPVRFPTETPESYRQKFGRMGGIVEEFVEYPEAASPSVQLRIDPHGEVVLLSSHDQILGGVSGQVYQGCRFPAADPTAARSRTRRARSAASSRDRGVVSRLRRRLLRRPAPGRVLGDVRAGDQSSHRRDDPSLPRPSVPDGRPAGSGIRPLLLARRPSQVLSVDGQPAVAVLSRAHVPRT